MEVDNAILSLACLARVYHGASVEDAGMLARKAVEVAGINADEVDLIDALNDVWAASMVAGTFVPVLSFDLIYPLSPKAEKILFASNDDEKHEASHWPDEEHVIPKRYKDTNLVAHKKKRNKKRRHWDKP